jgi:hypothetical protein
MSGYKDIVGPGVSSWRISRRIHGELPRVPAEFCQRLTQGPLRLRDQSGPAAVSRWEGVCQKLTISLHPLI